MSFINRKTRIFEEAGDCETETTRKRSEGRLKRIKSVFDNRAWSNDKEEQRKYFVELTAKPNNSNNQIKSGTYIPEGAIFQYLIDEKNGAIERLRKELDFYLGKCIEDYRKKTELLEHREFGDSPFLGNETNSKDCISISTWELPYLKYYTTNLEKELLETRTKLYKTRMKKAELKEQLMKLQNKNISVDSSYIVQNAIKFSKSAIDAVSKIFLGFTNKTDDNTDENCCEKQVFEVLKEQLQRRRSLEIELIDVNKNIALLKLEVAGLGPVNDEDVVLQKVSKTRNRRVSFLEEMLLDDEED